MVTIPDFAETWLKWSFLQQKWTLKISALYHNPFGIYPPLNFEQFPCFKVVVESIALFCQLWVNIFSPKFCSAWKLIEQKMVTNVATDSIFFKSNFIFCYYSNNATSETSICTFNSIWLLFLTKILGLCSKNVSFLGHLWKPGTQCWQLIITVKLCLNKDYYLLFTIKNIKLYTPTQHIIWLK